MRNQVTPRIQEKSPSAVPTVPGGSAGISVDIVQDAKGTQPALPLAPLPVHKGLPPVINVEPPAPKYYRVRQAGQVMYNNCRTTVNAGKIISDVHFDIQLLRKQGILLEELKGEG